MIIPTPPPLECHGSPDAGKDAGPVTREPLLATIARLLEKTRPRVAG